MKKIVMIILLLIIAINTYGSAQSEIKAGGNKEKILIVKTERKKYQIQCSYFSVEEKAIICWNYGIRNGMKARIIVFTLIISNRESVIIYWKDENVLLE